MCLDRAGLVGDDGPTHHGVFDLSYQSMIPNMTVAVPKDGNELRAMIHFTSDHKLDGPVSIRYPRGPIPCEMYEDIDQIKWGEWEYLSPQCETVVLATGTMVDQMQKAAKILKEDGIDLTIVNARFVKPLDMNILETIANSAKVILTAEENQLAGGFGEKIGSYLMTNGYQGKFRAFGIPDQFITHGNRDLLLKEIGLDVDSLVDEIRIMTAHKNGFLQKLRLTKKNNDHKKTSETEKVIENK